MNLPSATDYKEPAYCDAIIKYAEQLKQENSLVHIYDFGDGVATMPTPAPAADGETTYLRTSVCYLYIEKESSNGDLDWLNAMPKDSMRYVPNLGKIWEFGTGNFYIAIELRNEMTAEETTAALDAAKQKLLAVAHG